MLLNWKIKFGPGLIVVGIVFMSIFARVSFRVLIKPAIYLETVDQVKNLENGDHVKLDIKMIYDSIISETVTTSRGATFENTRYYVVPFFDFEKNEDYLLTVRLPSRDFSAAKKGIEAYEEFSTTGETPTEVVLTIDGVVHDMKDEERKLIPSEYEGIMDPIYAENENKKFLLQFEAIGAAFLIVGILIVLLYVRDVRKLKSQEQEGKINDQVPQNIYVQ